MGGMGDSVFSVFSLTGRRAMVTGGGSGIGREIALTLAAAGAQVTVVGRRAAALEETAQLISELDGAPAAAAMTCDLDNIGGIGDFMQTLTRQHGAPDIVVNNAGNNPRLPISQLTPDNWRNFLNVNLSAAFFVAQAAAPAMIQNGWGRIINLASLQCKLAFENGAAYGAAKGGIAQLTRAMAREWSRHGICANAIAPGFFPTDLTAPVLADSPKTADYLASRTAIGRNGKLSELRGVTLLLASSAADFITGQVIFVDGGFSSV